MWVFNFTFFLSRNVSQQLFNIKISELKKRFIFVDDQHVPGYNSNYESQR